MENRNRVLVFDINKNPVNNAHVKIFNKEKKLVASCYTNANGCANFWLPDSNHQKSNFDVIVKYASKYFEYPNVNTTYENKQSPLILNIHKDEFLPKLDIAFVVDATGSMGDEIQYLKSELIDVIQRIKKTYPCYELNTGSVFYKDHNDDYITKTLPLNNNPANIINFISEQYAGGGGDFPEALDSALLVGINNLNWSSESIKIMYLLLDAPPHSDEITKMKMQKYIQLAAQKGIRIIPIAASGINKSTEFLLKLMAIHTNGEYIYITDDSKIGNSHIKPTGGESKTEYLNDLIVKLTIKQFGKSICQENIDTVQSHIEQQSDTIIHNEILVDQNWQVQYYPNPSNSFVTIAS